MMHILGMLFDLGWLQSSIVRPNIHNSNIELNSSLLTWITNNVRFVDPKVEDPIDFLQ